jgi:pimeloyl-ACP methyl ester carboxylesterase
MDRLAGRFRTLAVDLYGSGKSPHWRADQPLTLADEVALLEPIFESIGDRFHLIGHSYGGAVALKAALAGPRRLRSLILFEPVLFGLLNAHDPAQREITAVRDDTIAAVDRGDLDTAGARFVEYWTGAGAWAGMPDERRRLVANAMRKVKSEWHAAFEEPASLSAFGALDVPTLSLVGRIPPRRRARSPVCSRRPCLASPRSRSSAWGTWGRSPIRTGSTR